jgi:predicted RNA methylase
MNKIKLKGLNRNIDDKFYTKQEIVRKMIELIKKNINIDKKKDLIIEPSAGNGMFIDYIKTISNNNIFIDIKPEHKDIIKQDYIKYDYNDIIKKYNKIHIIGNPPFGRQSSLAIKFIKKSCEFCDTISFILPKSFKKNSLKSKIPLNFHLVLEKDLPKNSFIINDEEHDVPCIIQIWVKKNKKRRDIKKINPIFFKFVKKDEMPDISIRRVGYYTGYVDINIKNKNINSHYFIKINDNIDKKIIDKLKKIKYKYNNTVGSRSISKNELISKFNRVYINKE